MLIPVMCQHHNMCYTLNGVILVLAHLPVWLRYQVGHVRRGNETAA